MLILANQMFYFEAKGWKSWNINHVNVPYLFQCIGNLRQLMYLDASKNRIESIPNEIESCLALGDLHLSINLLQQLPETIGNL